MALWCRCAFHCRLPSLYIFNTQTSLTLRSNRQECTHTIHYAQTALTLHRYKHTQGQSILHWHSCASKESKARISFPALCTKCVIMIFIIMIILLCYIIMMGTTFCTLPYYVLHHRGTTFCTLGVLRFAP